MKPISAKLKGVFVPMVTPFDKNENVDEDALRNFVHWLITQGVAGLYPEGGCGEVWKLSLEERLRIIEIVGEEAGGKVLFIPGTGGGSTRETIAITQHAKENGADAVIVWPPYFAGPQYSDDAIVDHFQTVADATHIPIVAYDAPEISGYPLSADLTQRLAEIEEIVGFKDSTGDLDKLADSIHRIGDNVAMIQGWESMFLACLAVGSPAGIMSAANVCGGLLTEIYEDFKRGDTEAAKTKNHKIMQLIFSKPWVEDQFQSMKVCLDMLGVPVGCVRKPWFAKPFSDVQKEELAEALRNLDLIK